MRLRMPKVKRVTSDDGKSSLNFSTTNGRGGGLYRFEIEWPTAPDGKLVGTMLVVPNSSFLAKEKAKEEGIDVDNWTMMEQFNYREKYAEKYGRLSYLNELKIPKGNYTPENICLIRDTICQLFLKLKASYEFNNDDPDCDPTLYYSDRIEFSPYDFNFDYLPYVKTFYAPGASIND